MTTTINLSEAKAKLSGILKRAHNGETFFITQRGKKVAEITPPMEVRLLQRQKAVAKLRKRWQAGRAKNFRAQKFVSRNELHEGHKY